MTVFDEEWKKVDLREPEARAAAKLLSKIGQPWEAYLHINGFYRVRPIKNDRADTIADFVNNLFNRSHAQLTR